MQILPQRNSNLRELPVAPGNNIPTTTTTGNFNRPGPVPGSNIRPVARATPGPRPAGAGLGRGRPPVGLATGEEPASTGRTVVRKEVPQVSYKDVCLRLRARLNSMDATCIDISLGFHRLLVTWLRGGGRLECSWLQARVSSTVLKDLWVSWHVY